MKWDFEGDYLQQFHPHYRGTIGDRFCRAVRAGCEDVTSVMEWVYQETRNHENAEWRKVARTCDTGEAYDFAMHILERESLPWQEKQRLKDSVADTSYGKDKMAKDPPTDKQLKYLKALGYKDVPKTKLEASDLIGTYKTSRPLPRTDTEETPF